MKQAVIIVYDGKTPSVRAQRDSARILAQYGLIDDLEKVEVYVLDEAEIVAAIAAKAICEEGNAVDCPKTPEDWAADVIFVDFEELLIQKDYDSFNSALSLKLSLELTKLPESDFIKAVRILTRPHAEDNIIEHREVFDNRILQIMRRSFYLVCQGRHIVFR